MQFTIKKSIYKTYKHIKLLFYNVLIDLLRKFNKNVNSIVNNIHLRFNWLIKLFLFLLFFLVAIQKRWSFARVEINIYINLNKKIILLKMRR